MVGSTDLNKMIEDKIGVRTFKLLRYLISGGTAAFVNWGTLFLLVHYARIYYLYASITAFIISIAASFTMQKFWTFQDNHIHDIHLQIMKYLLVFLFSLLLNTALVYLLVEKANVWYLLAQIVATAVIATSNFFCYRHFVFQMRENSKPNLK